MKEKLKNKKFVYTIIGIISVLLVAVAITYAYWLVTESQEGENVVTSACLDISLNGQNDITLQNQFPLSDEDGKKLTPYEFTVTNNCNTSVDYQVALEALGTESSAMSASALKVTLNDETPKILGRHMWNNPTLNDAYDAYILKTGTLAAASATSTEDSITYTLRLWIDENASIEEMNKTFRSKITVTIGQGIPKELPEIADTVNYNSGVDTYTGKWQVLGVENGQVKLVSDSIGTLTLQGKEGYTNGVTLLDNMAAVYGNGEGADTARSIRVEDINNLTGYNPYKTGTGTICFAGTAKEYGNTITYSYKDGAIYYKASNGLEGSLTKYTSYEDFDGTIISSEYPNNTVTITNNWYYYHIDTLTPEGDATEDSVGLKKGSPVYNLIYNFSSAELKYWLANQDLCTNESRSSWQMRMVWGDSVTGVALYHSFDDDDQIPQTLEVRAVVYLDKDVTFEKQEDGTFNIAI